MQVDAPIQILNNSPPSPAQRRFTAFAWGALAYNVAVILWGAWVRITGSGAGCGSHWPTCNGEVIPRAEATETMIEFAHRATSGLCLVAAVALVLGAFRLYPRGHAARGAAVGALGFVLSEALLGAGLVIFGLVKDDASGARAVVVSLHLVNTLALLGFGALTAWYAAGNPPLRRTARGAGLLWAGVGAFLLTSMAGAITALGDTLFPVDVNDSRDLFTRLGDDMSGAAHFLVQLRILHPVIATLSAFFLWFLSARWREGAHPAAQRLAWWVGLLALGQVAAGLINIGLAAPGWMQLVHLLLADALWIALVLLCAAATSPRAAQ